MPSPVVKPWLAPVALCLFFAATVHWLELPAVTGLWVDSPTRVLNDLIAEQAGSLSPQAFVAWMGLLFGLCSVFALRFAPRRALAPTLFSVVLGLCLFTTVRAIEHTLGSASVSGRGMSAEPAVVLDWVDRVLPAGSSAAIVPFPTGPSFVADADLWWDAEFWNRTVTEAYVTAGDDFRYTPFPTRTLAPEWETGRVPGTESAPPYVLMAEQDPRFGLAADSRVGKNYGVEILATARPYRVAWMSRGLQADGWTTPSRQATIRVFSAPHSATELTLGLRAPASASARYAVRAAESKTHARLSPGSARTIRLDVCAGPAGHADIDLVSQSDARIAGVQQSFAAVPSRRVGVAVASSSMRPLAGTCSA